MSVSGGIKVFDKSVCIGSDGATIVASSGDASSERAIDKNPITNWRSVGSVDSTTETITITFPQTETIDRILLVKHNWKAYTVKYNLLGVYTHFASVVGINGTSSSNITETTYARDTSYYEFTPVTTNSIQITVTSTQTANEEKYISRIIATRELGTFQGYPTISSLTHNRNQRVNKMLSGKFSIQKSEESSDFLLSFKDYPASYTTDLDLLFELYEKEENFLVWLCGGRTGSQYFRYQQRGFRLEDVYEMQIDKPIDVSYSDNVYINAINARVSLVEAV